MIVDISKDKFAYHLEDYRLEELDGDLVQALAYWESLCVEGVIPARTQFDLMKLPMPLIPNTHIFDKVDDGKDYKCRFWGTGVAKPIGKEMGGKRLTEQHPSKSFCATVIDEMNQTLDSGQPRVRKSTLHNVSGFYNFQIVLRMPLADEDGNPATCVTCMEFLSKTRTLEDKVKNIMF